MELKFDPDPKKKALAGIVNTRLSALDSAEAHNLSGVDNLYSEGNLAPEAVSPENYARRSTKNGYALEMRLAWKWIKTKDRVVNVGVGEKFGFAINFHDNDSANRDGSIQWLPALADEVWRIHGRPQAAIHSTKLNRSKRLYGEDLSFSRPI